MPGLVGTAVAMVATGVPWRVLAGTIVARLWHGARPGRAARRAATRERVLRELRPEDIAREAPTPGDRRPVAHFTPDERGEDAPAVVAWRVAVALGRAYMRIVPPAVSRTVGGRTAVVAQWPARTGRAWIGPSRRQKRRAAMLVSVTGNPEHYSVVPRGRVVVVVARDHQPAERPDEETATDATEVVGWRVAAGRSPLSRSERRSLAALPDADLPLQVRQRVRWMLRDGSISTLERVIRGARDWDDLELAEALEVNGYPREAGDHYAEVVELLNEVGVADRRRAARLRRAVDGIRRTGAGPLYGFASGNEHRDMTLVRAAIAPAPRALLAFDEEAPYRDVREYPGRPVWAGPRGFVGAVARASGLELWGPERRQLESMFAHARAITYEAARAYDRAVGRRQALAADLRASGVSAPLTGRPASKGQLQAIELERLAEGVALAITGLRLAEMHGLSRTMAVRLARAMRDARRTELPSHALGARERARLLGARNAYSGRELARAVQMIRRHHDVATPVRGPPARPRTEPVRARRGKGVQILVRGHRYPVTDRALVIGSGPGADVRVEDANLAPRHALVRRTERGDVLVRDLDSGTGTWIGDDRLLGRGETSAVRAGQSIHVAGVEIRVRARSAALEGFIPDLRSQRHRFAIAAVLSLAMGVMTALQPLLLNAVIERWDAGPLPSIALWAVAVLLYRVFSFSVFTVWHAAANRAVVALRDRLAAHLARVRLRHYIDVDGATIGGLVALVERVHDALTKSPPHAIVGDRRTLSSVVGAALVSPALAALVTVTAVAAALIMRWVGRKVVAYQRAREAARAQLEHLEAQWGDADATMLRRLEHGTRSVVADPGARRGGSPWPMCARS